jgi:hypothetical protein
MDNSHIYRIDTLLLLLLLLLLHLLLNESADYNRPRQYEPPGIMIRDAEGLPCPSCPDRDTCKVECVRFKRYVKKGVVRTKLSR